MRLGLSVGFSGSRVTLPMELIQEADRLGFHSAWTAEAYGSDAVTPATWIAAQPSVSGLGPQSCRCRRARRR
jgi:alkanesulfonate monooxygenase SsuD/methylene tetrahydromethanopterin reductase-like flavin-dependent oxidoreductase (luciferase family)